MCVWLNNAKSNWCGGDKTVVTVPDITKTNRDRRLVHHRKIFLANFAGSNSSDGCYSLVGQLDMLFKWTGLPACQMILQKRLATHYIWFVQRFNVNLLHSIGRSWSSMAKNAQTDVYKFANNTVRVVMLLLFFWNVHYTRDKQPTNLCRMKRRGRLNKLPKPPQPSQINSEEWKHVRMMQKQYGVNCKENDKYTNIWDNNTNLPDPNVAIPYHLDNRKIALWQLACPYRATPK